MLRQQEIGFLSLVFGQFQSLVLYRCCLTQDPRPETNDWILIRVLVNQPSEYRQYDDLDVEP